MADLCWESFLRAAVVRLTITLALVVSAASMSPVSSASEDPSPSTASPSAGASPGASPDTPDAAPGVTSGSARAARPTTRIYARPPAVTIYGKARFSYGSDVEGVRFSCRLRGPGRRATSFRTCPSDTPGAKSGRTTFTRLRASSGVYRFVVRAYLPATPGQPRTLGRVAKYNWHVFSVDRPSARFVPRRGATFNRPLSPGRQRVSINKMINTINAMPGYRQATRSTCPWAPELRPSSIRITLYSLTGKRFTSALIAAHRRCVSVQVLMNNHLDRNTDPAWRRLEDALGNKVYGGGRARRSFAYRCSFGCRGSGVLHTKMYLFDSHMPGRRYDRVTSTVATGSANMTFNATNIQYNDLYTVPGRPDLYRTYLRTFNLMKRDNGFVQRLIQVRNGAYQTTFWPQNRGGPDPQMQALRSIKCTGARGAGYRGRTVVYINMHAWFNTRGMRFARQVRRMHAQGCYVKVLYGFMSFGVFKQLRRGQAPGMTVRRTLFSRNGRNGYVYTHFKNLAVSGYVGNDRGAHVVWTGSNNYTNGGTHYDEVMMRIPFRSAYNAYRRQFQYISNRLSSPRYAIFQEPEGGGRAPRQMIRPRAIDVPEDEAYDLPPGTPVITSPDVVFDENGEPRALD